MAHSTGEITRTATRRAPPNASPAMIIASSCALAILAEQLGIAVVGERAESAA